jgi:hypothetical protein
VEAEKRGWLADEAGSPQSNLAKLKARRIDAILEPDIWFETYLNPNQLNAPTFENLNRQLAVLIAMHR